MASQFLQLVSSITENATKVAQYASENNMPQLSLDIGTPSKYDFAARNPAIEAARMKAIDATYQLQHMLLGPQEHLFSLGAIEIISLQAIVRFDLARAFPIGEEATFKQISDASGISESDTKRFLRHAVAQNIFVEPRRGVIKHNALSKMLAEDDRIRDWVTTTTEVAWPAATQTVPSRVKFPGSDEPNESGFSLANRTNDSLYEVLDKFPERAKLFSNSMSLYAQSAPYDINHLVQGYPWQDLGKATIVDMGGAHGDICKALLLANPELFCTVQDLPSTIQNALAPDQSIQERIRYMAHDFFQEQPVKDADAYLLRRILHNWGDRHCIRILRSLASALKPGARLLINDAVLPEPGKQGGFSEVRLRNDDMVMMMLFNAKERELDDWKWLVEQADGRLKFSSARQPQGSLLWILEWIMEPSSAP